MVAAESITGFFYKAFPLFNPEQFEKYRINSVHRVEKKFYYYEWNKKKLFIKIEIPPRGFELKDYGYLKRIIKCTSPYVTKYHDIVKLPNEFSQIKQGENIMIITEYNNSSFLADYLTKIDNNSHLFKIFLIRILKGFHSLHKSDVLHGDVNISNLLLHTEFDSSYPRIADINILKSDNDHALFVSPEYLAPEVKRHDQYNLSAEIWAIGVLMYFLIYRKYPFKTRMNGFSDIEVSKEIIQNNIIFDEGIDDATRDMLVLALDKDPNNRAASVKELLEILLVSLKFRKYFVY